MSLSVEDLKKRKKPEPCPGEFGKMEEPHWGHCDVCGGGYHCGKCKGGPTGSYGHWLTVWEDGTTNILFQGHWCQIAEGS
jgi:hypothetical protein